jgi:ribosomal protein S6--L-glutamate ligase
MRIGVFGNHDSWYVNELCRVGTARGHVIQPLLFDQFAARVQTGRVDYACGDIDLRSLDVVLVRTMPPGSLEQVVARMDMLAGLMACGVKIINSPRALECAVDKYLTTQRLALAGIPVPATIVCENSDTALEAFETLGQDVVVKPLFGAEGRGIMRVSDPELALRAFRTLERLGAVLYLQTFVSGPGFDIRVLLLDDQLVGSMKRIPKPGDFRANISQQGTGVVHVPTDRELELARQAANITGSLFAGVDLMYNADHEPLVIEVNAVPGWRGLQRTCDIDVPARLFEWLEIKKQKP